MMTRQELQTLVANGKIRELHTSYFRGYVRRTGGLPEPSAYNGKFGKGFTTRQPNFDSTQYSFVTYFIFN